MISKNVNLLELFANYVPSAEDLRKSALANAERNLYNMRASLDRLVWVRSHADKRETTYIARLDSKISAAKIAVKDAEHALTALEMK